MNAQQYRQLVNRLQAIEEAGIHGFPGDAVEQPPQAAQTALGQPPQSVPKDPFVSPAYAPESPPPQGQTGLLSKLQAMMSQLSPSEQDQLVKAFPQLQASAAGAMMQMPAKTGATGLPSKQGDPQGTPPSPSQKPLPPLPGTLAQPSQPSAKPRLGPR